MEIVNSYFADLIFVQVEEKENFVIYGAAVSTALGGGIGRYILLFVPSHLALRKRAKINDIAWKNLQTRELRYSYKLPKQSWRPGRDLPDPIFQIVERTKKYSKYATEQDFPFEVLLLHDNKKKTTYQFRNRMSLSSILESYASIFNYVGSLPSIQYISPSTLPPPVTDVSSYTLPRFSSLDDSFDYVE